VAFLLRVLIQKLSDAAAVWNPAQGRRIAHGHRGARGVIAVQHVAAPSSAPAKSGLMLKVEATLAMEESWSRADVVLAMARLHHRAAQALGFQWIASSKSGVFGPIVHDHARAATRPGIGLS